MTLKEEFEIEVKTKTNGINLMFETSNQKYIDWLEDKINKGRKLPIHSISERFLEYEEWYAKFEYEINTELAEIGADREMDFDCEREFNKRYEMYLNSRSLYKYRTC